MKPVNADVIGTWKSVILGIASRAGDLQFAANEWERLQPHEFDTSTSKALMGWWIELNGGSVNWGSESKNKKKTKSDVTGGGTAADCTAHEACANLKLAGLCCPTERSVFLECCNMP